MKKKTWMAYAGILLALVVFIAAVMVCSHFVLNKFFPKASPIQYPVTDNIQSASLSDNSDDTVVLDQAGLEELLLHISCAQPTRRISVNDYPSVKPHYTVTIQTLEREYRYYVYEEDSQVYIEIPYSGIYRTNHQIIDFILKHYAK